MPLATQYFKAREARRQVLIACRMKSATGWGDVCIHNISSRGMMIASDAALFPGAYIEIRRGQQTVISPTSRPTVRVSSAAPPSTSIELPSITRIAASSASPRSR